MINKDEAFEMLVAVSDEWNQKQQQALNKIYDSIGSCGECKYKKENTLKCQHTNLNTQDDWFCADFEREVQ